MNNIETSAVQKQNLNSNATGKVLKDGNQVLVRVIANNGGGKYEGSVAGVKVNFTSQKTLMPGTSFAAVVHMENGIIQLSALETKVGTDNYQLTLLKDTNLLQLLQNLGLPQDNLSATLLQQMQQLDMKYDLSALTKIRNMAVRVKGKEKQAAEILMAIKEKGVEITLEELLGFLMELNGDFDKENDEDCFKKLNQFNSKTGHWYFFPFEIVEYNKKQSSDSNEDFCEVLGTGNLKLLYNLENTEIKQVGLNCKYFGKFFSFLLPYNENHCNIIYMNVEPASGKEKGLVKALENKFRLMNKQMQIQWVDREVVEGTGSSFEQLYSFKGAL